LAASYFDVDGTLVSTNVIHPTLFYLLNQGTPLASFRRLGRTVLQAPAMAMAEIADRRLFNELLYGAYQGMSEDRLLVLADEAFDKVMRPYVYAGARGLVRRAREGERKVVFISGALDFIVERLAEHLGADEVIANRLEMKNGVATGKLLKPVVAGPEKARIIREHARANGHDLDDCYAFSDSYSDIPMLSVVGHPAAVNPDRRLSVLAKSYSWPSFDLTRNP
jgi:HAD superfamily hydrolase (TIGR01490 family)